MSDPTAEFFQELSTRGDEPLLRDVTATVRFDVLHGKRTDRWCLRIDKGHLEVTTGEADADAVISMDRTVFDAIVSRGTNAMAAFLRGELMQAGEPELIVSVQRLFPGPRRTAEKQPVAAQGRRSS
jgi:putative sterol carrier protein